MVVVKEIGEVRARSVSSRLKGGLDSRGYPLTCVMLKDMGELRARSFSCRLKGGLES